MKGYVYTSPFAVKHIQLGRDEGIKLGRDEGVKLALLTVSSARSIDVPEATRECILAEKDIAHLERWLERAATASSIDDVFAEST